MHGSDFFYQAFVYLSAAIVAVPLAKRLGLGSVLGYLLAGVLIGPYMLGMVGEEGQDVMRFAEFGVVMMLFLIGLELQPALIWKMRTHILGMGGLQVTVTALLITGIAVVVSPLSWKTGLAIGLSLALSSTAIVLQTLNEKGVLKTQGGQRAFSVLLFQDVAVIPILAIMPLLSVSEPSITPTHQTLSWVDGLSLPGQFGVVLGGITFIVFAGRYLMGPILRMIARTLLRELFTAAALLLIISIALLMIQVGLSPALGTFLAGVVLAQSEYRHELETNIEPFKGLLLGLFFIAVGASVDFDLIINNPAIIALLVAALIVIKLLVLIVIGRLFGLGMDNNLLFSFSLAQGGEFAFVLFSYALQTGAVTNAVVNPMIASVAVSMAFTPLLMLLNEKFIQPRFGVLEAGDLVPESEPLKESNGVIIAGFGRFGSTVGRFLQANGIRSTYLDIDPDNVELLRRMGFEVFYGDASRHDLLESAGLADAKLLIVAVGDPEKAMDIIKTARKYFPHLKILSRSHSLESCYDMMENRVEGIYRDYLDSSLRMASDALVIMGFRKFHAHRIMKSFRRHEEHFMKELATVRHKHSAFISGYKQRNLDIEQMMLDDLEISLKDKNLGWDASSRKNEFKSKIHGDDHQN